MKNLSLTNLLLPTIFLFLFFESFCQLNSPSTAGVKFIETPVNPLNGTSSFNIPIYTLSEGTLSHNISLDYHTGGIKAGEVASPIGAGWNLNAGGFITRIQRGQAKDDVNINCSPAIRGYQNAPFGCYSDGSGCYPLCLVYVDDDNEPDEAICDYEMDMFIYNFNGITGKFVVDKNGIIQLIDKQDISIILHKDGDVLEDLR